MEHKSENNGNKKLCEMCLVSDGKYVCPRCNLLYCSVDCYRSDKHAVCSEAFYKECVMNDLLTLQPENDSQKKMVEILKRLNPVFDPEFTLSDEPSEQEILDSDDDDDDDDDEEEDDSDLINRLEGIDLDCADEVWDRLNDKEKMEFEKLLQSGDVADVLPEFEPWWGYENDKKIIDLQEESYFEKVHKDKCPRISKNIVPFSAISKSSPSPVVVYNLINVLAAYSFVVRYYNGDHLEFYNEAAITLVMLSKNLFSSQNFIDFDSSVNSALFEITNSSLLHTSLNSCDEIKSDIKCIMKGPDINNLTSYVLAALSDIHDLFSKFIKCSKSYKIPSAVSSSSASTKPSEFSKRFPECNSTSSNGLVSNVPVTKSSIKNLIKKIEFYQSWVLEHYKSPVSLYR